MKIEIQRYGYELAVQILGLHILGEPEHGGHILNEYTFTCSKNQINFVLYVMRWGIMSGVQVSECLFESSCDSRTTADKKDEQKRLAKDTANR